ncbi:BnaC05g00220D [Brassica napus]|uniref:BnaC05g00220D protein n=1 Tax=Brassica napus TaxID=3708 RepID=A0A078FS92_BRANA|nr:BnaC05g00220D [Brassica napus]
MASSDVVLGHSTFDALRLGRSAQMIVGRLLRFWDSKNIKKQGEFMGITLLFLDEKNSVIHGFIPAGRAPFYRPSLRAGSVVRVSRFEVARCTNMYKITDHPFVIRFIPQTTIAEVIENAPVINVEKFMLRSFDPLQALANTNLELPDVVGQIQRVVVYLSLWDDAASMFRGLIGSGDRTQTVMVVTTVNPKLFGGNLYLNSTPATKFYFDNTLEAISEFTARLDGPVQEAFTCIDTKEGIRKKEVLSIGELNKFISNSNEQTQEAEFICKARVVDVLQQNGWSFVSCTGCSRKLDKDGSSLRCNRCVNPNITGEMLKLTKQDAAALTLNEINGGGGVELPQCLKDLGGQDFVFQIRVTPFNFTPNHRTFTVSAIVDTIVPETFKTNAAELVQVEGGEASATGSNMTGSNMTGGEEKEPNPSNAGGKGGVRKRTRE